MPLLSAKPKKPPVRYTEKVEVRTPKPATKPASSTVSAHSKTSSRPSHQKPKFFAARKKNASPYPSSSDEKKRADRKRKQGSADPLQPRFDKDSDGEDDDVFAHLESRKRHRFSEEESVDESRVLTCGDAFVGEAPKALSYIHGADITNSARSSGKNNGGLGREVASGVDTVQLQYPSLFSPESYELLIDNVKIDAFKDAIEVATQVAHEYLPEKEALEFTEPNTGLIRRLKRAANTHDVKGFKEALETANEKVLSLVRDGVFQKVLDQKHSLPRKLVEFILTQVYDRTVAPDVEKLKQYTNGTDNVYGELNYAFISKILQEKTHMVSSQVFVDLGSGVGNVVFQAALEIGCESWGCEMMDNPCDFAEAQKTEFDKRCRLWGLTHGEVNLVRGDFLREVAIHAALKRADVVLVNNQAFTPDLNAKLVNLFLDLKQGCKIVSLKSFTHDQGTRNINDVASNILQVEHHTYPEGHVSWTNAGGTFCISTRK